MFGENFETVKSRNILRIASSSDFRFSKSTPLLTSRRRVALEERTNENVVLASSHHVTSSSAFRS